MYIVIPMPSHPSYYFYSDERKEAQGFVNGVTANGGRPKGLAKRQTEGGSLWVGGDGR